LLVNTSAQPNDKWIQPELTFTQSSKTQKQQYAATLTSDGCETSKKIIPIRSLDSGTVRLQLFVNCNYE